MLRRFAAVPVVIAIASACASAEAPSWKLTRDGVELRRSGAVTRIELPGWRWAGPPYGRALALGRGPRGEVLVTSDVLPVVWRIDPSSLAVSVHPLALDADRDKDAGFVQVRYARAAGAYFARGAMDGACWRIDAALRHAQKLSPGEKPPLAAAGICVQQ